MEIRSAPIGPASLFSMAAFGRPDQQFQQQLQQRNQQTQQFLSQNYGFDSSAFFNQSRQFFQTYYNLSGMRQAEAIIETGQIQMGSNADTAVFTPVINVDDFIRATWYQQQYMMANPYLRQMYLDKKINGFSETYTNHFGDRVGFEDPVYRQAVSGLSQSSYMELESDMDEVYVENCDDEIGGLENLTPLGQSNMVEAWKKANVLVDEGVDVTSKTLDSIGD